MCVFISVTLHGFVCVCVCVCFTFHSIQVHPEVPLQFAAFGLRVKHKTRGSKRVRAEKVLRCSDLCPPLIQLDVVTYGAVKVDLGAHELGHATCVTHVLFAEVDNSLLKGNVFGLIGFAKLLENLSVKQIIVLVTEGK